MATPGQKRARTARDPIIYSLTSHRASKASSASQQSWVCRSGNRACKVLVAGSHLRFPADLLVPHAHFGRRARARQRRLPRTLAAEHLCAVGVDRLEAELLEAVLHVARERLSEGRTDGALELFLQRAPPHIDGLQEHGRRFGDARAAVEQHSVLLVEGAPQRRHHLAQRALDARAQVRGRLGSQPGQHTALLAWLVRRIKRLYDRLLSRTLGDV
eukprot:6208239-Pleurochrysis_carterae.AAC.1